jgi:release factor glutamine methyltransferase
LVFTTAFGLRSGLLLVCCSPVSTEALAEVWTVRRVLIWTQQRFAQSGLHSPRLDAEILLSHSLGKSRVGLYTSFEQPLVDQELSDFKALIRRRLAGEPVAYLTGQREFYSLPLHVTPAVLIPRPETELLVEEALRLIDAAKAPPPVGNTPDEESPDGEVQSVAVPGVPLTVLYDPEPTLSSDSGETEPSSVAESVAVAGPAERMSPSLTVVDVGTGSGAIALAVKHERPSIRMIAVDRSPEALEIAKRNAATLQLEIEFRQGDLLSVLGTDDDSPDLVLANLPYIPTAEIAGLSKDVQSEPRMALDGGADGLALVERLVAMTPGRLRPGGSILLEIGAGQSTSVERLLRSAGFADVHSLRDLAGIERVVCGRLPTDDSRRVA